MLEFRWNCLHAKSGHFGLNIYCHFSHNRKLQSSSIKRQNEPHFHVKFIIATAMRTRYMQRCTLNRICSLNIQLKHDWQTDNNRHLHGKKSERKKKSTVAAAFVAAIVSQKWQKFCTAPWHGFALMIAFIFETWYSLERNKPSWNPFLPVEKQLFFLEFSNDIAITRPTSLPRDCHGLKEDLLFWTFMSKLKTSLPVHRFNWIALLLKTQYNVNGVYAFHSKFM